MTYVYITADYKVFSTKKLVLEYIEKTTYLDYISKFCKYKKVKVKL